MGLIKAIVWIVVIIIATAIFFPATYEQGKAWTLNKLKDWAANKISDKAEDTFNYTMTDLGKDYGKILGFRECESDTQCSDFFKIEEMKCSPEKTCYVEVN